MKRTLQACLVIGTLLLALAALAPPAAAACGDPLDVQVDGDACASTLAVSITGDAQGSTSCRGLVSCVAVSGTGNAANNVGDNECGVSNKGLVGCVAVSGAGSATNSAGGNSCGFGGYAIPVPYNPWLGVWVFYPSAGCVAASAAGDASNNFGDGSCGVNGIEAGCIAVSGLGDARNEAHSSDGYADCGRAIDYAVTVGCIAVSGAGDAENHAGAYSCGYAGGKYTVSVGCIALSGTGNSNNDADGGFGGSGACGENYDGAVVALGCVASSGTGSASNTGSKYNPGWGWGTPPAGPCETDTNSGHTGVGISCLAVSGGTASNTVDGQSCEADLGAYSPGGQSIRCLSASPASAPAPVASPASPIEQQVSSPVLSPAPDPSDLEPTPADPVPDVPHGWWDGLVATLNGWFRAVFGGEA